MKKREVRVLSLRPTQFAVGLYEIREKAREIKKLSKRKKRKYLEEKRVPVVLSPEGLYYVTDHHHHLFACFLAGIKHVPIRVEKDLSQRSMGFGKFWRYMCKSGYAYLYDQFGTGPRSALYLPEDVRGMADDPYRSLAWAVRIEGGYENCDLNFSEFQWADFFRSKKLLEREGRGGFKRAIESGVRHAKSKSARKLPGYTG